MVPVVHTNTHSHTVEEVDVYCLSFSHVTTLQPVVPTVLFETLQLPTNCKVFLAEAISILSARNYNPNASRMSSLDLEIPK